VDIPIFARIVALVDVYDALCSDRVYKDAWEEPKALTAIEEGAGRQFDPELVEIFFGILPIIHAIKERYRNIPVK
jgi:response regulator RpfG family c-di-GMP phosphodiesterase